MGGGDGVASLPQVKGNLASCREGEGPDIYKLMHMSSFLVLESNLTANRAIKIPSRI